MNQVDKWIDIPIPNKNYDLNQDQINKWVEFNSSTNDEKVALQKFFSVTKYVSFEEFQIALSQSYLNLIN